MQRGGEPVAAGQVELAVGAAQVHLDGLGREVEAAGDLPVGSATGGDLRHAPLGGRERVRAGARGRPRSPAREQQLRSRALAQGDGAAGMSGVVRVAEDRASGAALAGGTPAGAELGQAARQLEPRVAGREMRSGLLEQRDRRSRGATSARIRAACPSARRVPHPAASGA